MLKPQNCSWLAFAVVVAVSTTMTNRAAAQLYFGEGTWVSDDGIVSGTWRGTIDAAGEDLSGTLNITGIPGLTEAKIDGTFYPGVIDFALIQWDSEVASITGTITDDSVVAGTFVMPIAVTGTWHGQVMEIPDDATPTPVEDDPPPDESTPTPGGDQLTQEDLDFLALIEGATVTPAPPPTTITPDVAATPTASVSEPTATAPVPPPTATVIPPTPTVPWTPTVPTVLASPTLTPTPPDGCEYMTLAAAAGWTTVAIAADAAPTFAQCLTDTGEQSLAAASTLEDQHAVITNMLLSWDTSALPVDLVVNNAWLRVFVQYTMDANLKALSGDWYAWGPDCDTTDHTNDAPTGALSTDGACGTSCDLSTMVAGQDYDFPLDDALEHIVPNGTTDLRLHVDADQVTGFNGIQVANASDGAISPRLVVLLCAPTSTATPLHTPADTPTETPTYTPTGASTDTPADTPAPTPSAADLPTDVPTATAPPTPTSTPTPSPGQPTPIEVPPPTDSPTPPPPDIPTDTPAMTPTETAPEEPS